MARGRKPLSGTTEASRRKQLLHAAVRLFVERGFDATTTRDIAEAVGMRSGSPFYHFRSKQDLLKAAMIEGLEAACQRNQAATRGIDAAGKRLQVLIRTHLGSLLEGECQAPMLLNESRALDAAARAEIAAAFDRYQAAWQETLDELYALGRIASAAAPVRLFLFGMLNWSSQWYRRDGALTLDQLADQALLMILGGKQDSRLSNDPE